MKYKREINTVKLLQLQFDKNESLAQYELVYFDMGETTVEDIEEGPVLIELFMDFEEGVTLHAGTENEYYTNLAFIDACAN